MATEFEFKVTGVPAVARALADMRGELDSVARKHDFLAAAQRASVPAMDSLNQQIGRSTMAAASGNRGFITLAKAAKSLTPALSGMAASAAGGAGAMGTLAASFGPVGIGVGVLLTAFGLAKKVIDDADAAVGGIARSADIARQSFDDLLSAIQKADQAAARASRLAMGLGSSQEQRAAEQELEQASFGLTAERTRLRALLRTDTDQASDIARQLVGVERQLQANRTARLAARADTERALQEEGDLAIEDADNANADRRRGGHRSSAKRFAGDFQQLRADAGIGSGRVGFGVGEAVEMKEASTLGRGDFDISGDLALVESKREQLTLNQEIADSYKDQNDSITEQQELLKGIGSNMMALGVGIFEQGPKKAFKAWAKQFAIQQGGLAIEALAMAAPLLLTPGGQATGGAYLERAALHGAAAAAVGAAGAATGGGSRRGGGGGARPEQPSSMAGQSGPAVPNQITVHINSPVPESELGRMNARAAQEAERRFGR